ncbi:hypothetical protein SNE40_014094 [Patella caerulea]|uniref:Urease accessory protein UreF n=1 Tax=Patella caerulea TaxID=87958 RepID=A0AAN8PIK7_PATCE
MNSLELLNLLQLSDSAFPIGSFSHSCGLESAVQHGLIKSKDDLRSVIIACLENTGSFSLPFVTEAYNKSWDSAEIQRLDNFHHISVSNHVANRASSKQGKSLLGTVVQVYQFDELITLSKHLQHCHYAVLFGVVFSVVGMDLKTTQTAFMSGVLRTIISSAVRLDQIGPIEAQKIQLDLLSIIPDIILRNDNKTSADASIKSPILDISQNSHDILFSKLFYS